MGFALTSATRKRSARTSYANVLGEMEDASSVADGQIRRAVGRLASARAAV